MILKLLSRRFVNKAVKKALITGAFGQDGYFLTKKLVKHGDYKIIATGRTLEKSINHAYNHPSVSIEHLDINSECEIYNLVKKHKPDEIYHLASFSAPVISWNHPQEVISINGSSTIYLLDAIRLFSKQTKFFFASSAKIFGNPLISPQTENTPINPLDPYSLGKFIGHQAVKLYRNKYKIFATNGILYNHESHLKNSNFVTYKICHYAKLIKKKEIKKFTLMNLNSKIDLGDPRDYVEAMHKVLQETNPDDYIIAMNRSISIKDICLRVGKILNIPDFLNHIEIADANRGMNSKELKGDNNNILSIGWKPKFTIDDSIKLILNGDY